MSSFSALTTKEEIDFEFSYVASWIGIDVSIIGVAGFKVKIVLRFALRFFFDNF